MDSERELAAACARGDQGAWLELIRRYDRTVARVLWVSGAREDADDLRQETYARLLARDGASLKSFRADRAGSLRAFLAAVARAVAIDHGRSRRLRPPGAGGEEPGGLAHAAPGPEEELSRRRTRERLSVALDQAAADGENAGRDRDILRLHFEEGHTTKEIAEMGLGLSVRGVEALLRRAKERLTVLLQDDG